MGFDVYVTNKISDLFLRKYEVVYVWWWSYALLSILLSKIKRAKCIVAGAFHYSTPLMSGTDFVRRSYLYKLLVTLSLRMADMNIFVSICEYEAVTKNLKVNNPMLVYHGIDTDKYSPADLNIERDGLPVLLCISWMEKNNIERKCIYEVVRALDILYGRGIKAKLLLVGRPGNGYDDFRAYVSSLSCAANIEFVGHVTEKVKIELLRSSTIYVSPTLYEGFGIAIAEALSCGCPVITSENGAVPEVVGHCATYVSPNSPESIANSIECLLQSSDIRERFSILGRKRILKRYTYEHHSKNLASAVSSLLD